MPGPLPGPARDDPGRLWHGTNEGAEHVWRDGRPPVKATDNRRPQREYRWPPVRHRSINEQRAALITVALPRRAHPLVKQRSATVHHRAQALPQLRTERVAGRSGFDRRQHAELGNERLIVRRQLAIDPGREGVADELRFEQARRLAPPAVALGEPRERAARDQ